MIFDQNLAIYTVFYKESESEVRKCQILEPGGEKYEKLIVKRNFSIFFTSCGYFSLREALHQLMNNFKVDGLTRALTRQL